jgi:hypothetical protein
MIGNNELRLNTETVTEALQRYFDEVLFRDGKRVQIVSLNWETDNNYGSGTFKVIVQPVEPGKAAP